MWTAGRAPSGSCRTVSRSWLKTDPHKDKGYQKIEGDQGTICVVSDIHGCYDEYLALVGKASFGGDILYLLGDIIDRGPKGLKILLDTMVDFMFESQRK